MVLSFPGDPACEARGPPAVHLPNPASFVWGFGSHPGNVPDQGPENGLFRYLVVFCFCQFYCYLFNKLILSEFSKSILNSRETANSQTNKSQSLCQLLLLSWE